MIETEGRPAGPVTVTLDLSPDEASLLQETVVPPSGVDDLVTEIVRRALYKSIRLERPLRGVQRDQARSDAIAARRLVLSRHLREQGVPQDDHQRRALADQLGISIRTLGRDIDLVLREGSEGDGRPGRTQRQLAIERYIDQHGEPVGETQKRALAKQLGVSQRTLYRDLDIVLAARARPPVQLPEPGEKVKLATPRLRRVAQAEVRPGRKPKRARRRSRHPSLTPGAVPDGTPAPE